MIFQRKVRNCTLRVEVIGDLDKREHHNLDHIVDIIEIMLAARDALVLRVIHNGCIALVQFFDKWKDSDEKQPYDPKDNLWTGEEDD